DFTASAGDAGTGTADHGDGWRPNGDLYVRRGSSGNGRGGDATQRADPSQCAVWRAVDSGVDRREPEPERHHGVGAIMRMRSVVLLTTILCCSAWGQNYTISTIAGGPPANIPGTSAGPLTVAFVAADSAGNVFFAAQNAVLRLDATTGILTPVAGTGTRGFSGDNGPATSAQLSGPAGVAVDSTGNLYIVDQFNYRIRKVSNGVITTVAGNGTHGFGGDNGPATSAQFRFSNGGVPIGLAVDFAGNLYIADYY